MVLNIQKSILTITKLSYFLRGNSKTESLSVEFSTLDERVLHFY
jgi:hypothetical protein